MNKKGQSRRDQLLAEIAEEVKTLTPRQRQQVAEKIAELKTSASLPSRCE